MSWTRRAFLVGAGGALGAVGAQAVTAPSHYGAGLMVPQGGEGVLNDASLLSETPVASHAVLREEPGEALVTALRAELRAAAAEGRAVSIGAARHSMGAHAIPRDGRAVTLDSAWMEADAEARVIRVHAGARWRDVIATLDPLGLSPAVMQSNHDFGVAATFPVNAHGWPTAFGPMGATVRSLGMVLANGSAVTASRRENADLFHAAMGGYGLVGLITDLEVEVVPNALLQPVFQTLPAQDFASAFVEAVRRSPMSYGRLNVDREGFFEEALLVTYEPVDGDIPPAEGSGFMSRASRPVFRAQAGSEWVKRRRW